MKRNKIFLNFGISKEYVKPGCSAHILTTCIVNGVYYMIKVLRHSSHHYSVRFFSENDGGVVLLGLSHVVTQSVASLHGALVFVVMG